MIEFPQRNLELQAETFRLGNYFLLALLDYLTEL